MRKLICLTTMGVLAMGLGMGITGCSEESKTQSQVTQSTPGGKTTETTTNSLKQSGENPPPPSKNP
jgi:hypothetical protein